MTILSHARPVHRASWPFWVRPGRFIERHDHSESGQAGSLLISIKWSKTNIFLFLKPSLKSQYFPMYRVVGNSIYNYRKNASTTNLLRVSLDLICILFYTVKLVSSWIEVVLFIHLIVEILHILLEIYGLVSKRQFNFFM